MARCWEGKREVGHTSSRPLVHAQICVHDQISGVSIVVTGLSLGNTVPGSIGA